MIGRLGRDIRFRGRGFGRFLIEFVFATAIEVHEKYCGVRMVTLDAYPDRVEYYESLGFVQNQHQKYRRRTKSVSMRYDIYEKAFPECSDDIDKEITASTEMEGKHS